jgi:hypothetical protein
MLAGDGLAQVLQHALGIDRLAIRDIFFWTV